MYRFHPVIFSIVLPTYNSGVGKALLFVSQRLKLLSFPVYPEEKRGGKPKDFPKKYPNALAHLLELQLTKLEALNNRRKLIAGYYHAQVASLGGRVTQFRDGSIYLRQPFIVPNPNLVISRAKKSGILLGNWYHNTIDPTGVSFENIGYRKGSCPKAEETAGQITNLPTNISEGEAKLVMDQLYG